LDIIKVIRAGLAALAALFADDRGNLWMILPAPADDERNLRKKISRAFFALNLYAPATGSLRGLAWKDRLGLYA
jgi:hypothetical protein